jgi:fibronectin type 3 domain-containing protein
VKKLGLLLLAIVVIGLAVLFLPSLHKSRPHSVTLSWRAPEGPANSNVVNFNIYRGTTLGGPYARVASGVHELNYKDTAVNAGVTYFYVVRSVDSAGTESPASEEIKVTVPGD